MELSFPLLIQVSCCVIALTYRNPPDDRDDDALPSFFLQKVSTIMWLNM